MKFIEIELQNQTPFILELKIIDFQKAIISLYIVDRSLSACSN